MANSGMTAVNCRLCGTDHSFTPTALAALVIAFQDGDAQRVTGIGSVESLCLVNVLQERIGETDPRRNAFRGTIAFANERPKRGRPAGAHSHSD